MSENDDDKRANGRSRQLVASLVILAVTAVAILVAVLLPHKGSGEGGRLTHQTTPPSTSPQDQVNTGAQAAEAIAVLARQDRLIHHGSLAAYRRTWVDAGSAQRQASSVIANLRALDVRTLHARYVAAESAPSSAEQRRLGGQAWVADVDIAWRVSGIDQRDAHATLSYTFVRNGHQVHVARMTVASGSHEPVWLLGRLDVRRSDRTLVAATTPAAAARLDRALQTAVTDVAKVVPDWHGDLVAYGPSTTRQLEAVLAASPGAYDGIAAVTTTIDGSQSPQAPAAIVVNPTQFRQLGPVGAHVVITHESTHLATGAAAASMPLWVAEGFADYVGVGSVDVPLSVSARVAVKDVRRNGLPSTLPSDQAFRGGSRPLEAVYEQAWLAMRLIATTYGQDRLVAFYEDVVSNPDAVASSLRRDLGITQAQLTGEWRTYLRDLARGR